MVARRRQQMGKRRTRSAAWAYAVIALCATNGKPAALAAEKPTLKSVIEKVRANEKLYRNLEMTVLREYKHERANQEKNGKGGALVASIKSQIRVLFGEGRFSYREESAFVAGNPGKTTKRVTNATNYGKKTIIVRTDSSSTYAQIYHGRHLEWGVSPLLTPNTFLGVYVFRTQFSRFLTVRDKHGKNLIWSVIGEEKVDGLKCVKLQFQYDEPNLMRTWQRSFYWLAIDRNYQPVKVVRYNPVFSKTIPGSIARVTKFMQLKPGIWLPSATKAVTYDGHERTKGNKVLNQRISYTVRKAILHAKLDDSNFKAVKIPKGAPVAELRDGEVVKRYRQK